MYSSKNTDNVCLAFAFLSLITDQKPQKINLNAYMLGKLRNRKREAKRKFINLLMV